MSETKVRNCSIDIFRYICAIMVVAIHTHPLSDINAQLGYILVQIIPRVGVPFFFATAGYFYIQKLEKGKAPFFKSFKRLLITYIIWTCLYYLIDFVRWGYSNPKYFGVTGLFNFFIAGSHYHFWFFPAIIFAVCCTTLIFKIRLSKCLIPLSIILYSVGCFGCSYYELGVNIPFLEKLYTFSQFDLIRRVLMMGFPFFVCGYFVHKIKDKVFNRVSTKKLLLIWCVTIAVWLIEIYIVWTFNWQTNIIITFGLYLLVVVTLLVLLKIPLPQYESLSSKTKFLANFTYYSHPFLIEGLDYITNNYIQLKLTETPMFILVILLTCLWGLIIYKLDNKWLNRIVN